MRLLVDRLTDRPTAERHVLSRSWLAEWLAGSPAFAGALAGEQVFEFEASRVGNDVLLEGRFEGAMEVECSRCGKRYRQPLREAWRLVLEPAGERTRPDPEGEALLARHGLCLAEDLELGWYRGKELELDPFFAEVVSLAEPLQPLCREDCAGLCPRCGIDRNEETCSCSDVNPDSPFAVLAALRGGSEGSA